MKKWLTWSCCLISFLLLTGCAALNLGVQDKTPPPSTAPPPPPPSPPPAPAKEISLNWVYFEYDKAALTRETIAILEETIKVLEENPSIAIELAGHTDAKGTDAYNLRLSQRRVKRVQEYLTSEGISESRLRTAAFGKAKPIADDETEKGRAQNRRVEIRIIKQE